VTIFKSMVLHLREPICLCLEQRLCWTVEQTKSGPSLLTWCQGCGTKLQVPNSEFKAVFHLDRPYPGRIKKIAGKQAADYMEYLKRRRPGPPS
jgi:hypothetical protein